MTGFSGQPERHRIAPLATNQRQAPTAMRDNLAENWHHLTHWEGRSHEDMMIPAETDDVLQPAVENDFDVHGVQEVSENDLAAEESVGKRHAGTKKLTQEDIVAIMNERIAHYTHAWVPFREKSPLELWEEAETKGQRQELMQACSRNIEYYEDRLNKMCDEILKDQWYKKETIRHVCGNLEGTVESLEEAKWLLEIYELPPEDEDDAGSIEVIDLGSDGESSASQSTNERHCNSQTPAQNVVSHHGDAPELASITIVMRWSWKDLGLQNDRKRVVMKALQEMGLDQREALRMRLLTVQKQNLVMEMRACIDMLCRRENKLNGVLARDLDKIVALTRLFLCWWLAANAFQQDVSERSLKKLISSLEGGANDLEVFYHWVVYLMNNTFSKEALKTCAAPRSEIIVISDDEDGG